MKKRRKIVTRFLSIIHVLLSSVYLANIAPCIPYFDSQTRIEIRISFAVYITEPGRFLFQIRDRKGARRYFLRDSPSIQRCETRLPRRFASNLVSINEIIQIPSYMAKLFAIGALFRLEKLRHDLFRVRHNSR